MVESRGRITLHQYVYKDSCLTLMRDDHETQKIELSFDGNGYQFDLTYVMQCLKSKEAASHGRVDADPFHCFH